MSVYVVFTRKKTVDQSELDIYTQAARHSLEGHDVTIRAAYGSLENLEGEPIEGAVIAEFPTMAQAKAWYESLAYQAAAKHRRRGADYDGYIVAGVS